MTGRLQTVAKLSLIRQSAPYKLASVQQRAHSIAPLTTLLQPAAYAPTCVCEFLQQVHHLHCDVSVIVTQQARQRRNCRTVNQDGVQRVGVCSNLRSASMQRSARPVLMGAHR